jgi:hypothetical protein
MNAKQRKEIVRSNLWIIGELESQDLTSWLFSFWLRGEGVEGGYLILVTGPPQNYFNCCKSATN